MRSSIVSCEVRRQDAQQVVIARGAAQLWRSSQAACRS